MNRVHTIGCRVNQCESHWLAEQLTPSTHTRAFHVVNTCAVTANAERKGRQLVRRLRRIHPQAWIIAVGCQAERDPAGLMEAGADMAVGNAAKEHLPTWFATGLDDPHVLESGWGDLDQQEIHGATSRARVTIKIQDGCARQCTFCITRRLRGPLRSKSPHVIKREVEALRAAGHREIVLAGIDLGAYGQGEPEKPNLPELMEELLHIPRVRYRLSSIGPRGISSHLLSLMAREPRICPHLHVPLQSADDVLLRAMGRGYTAGEYMERLSAFLETVPHATFGTDLMVGFPGETEAAFVRSLRFLEPLRPLNTHVFRFSPRPGTPAAALGGRIPASTAAARARRASFAANRWSFAARSRFIGRTLKVIAEQRQDGWARGHSENFIRIAFPHGNAPQGTIAAVRVAYVDGTHTMGVKQDRNANM